MSATSTFSDPTGRYAGVADLMNRNAVAGFQMWAPHLGDNGANIEISFYLVTNYANRGGGSSYATTLVGEHQGLRVYDHGSAYELRTGHDVNGSQPDLRVFFDVDYLSRYYWINPLDGTPAPANRSDLVQVIAHEIGHALAFNGSLDWARYSPRGGEISRFDTFVTTSGGGPYFAGPSAVAVYGGPVPLTAGNLYHLGNPGGPEALITDLMNGVVMMNGSPYRVSDLDLAILSDSGVPTRLSDTLSGSAHNDTMAGGEGDDRIAGKGGNDVLIGDAGADVLHGEEGSDDLRGGTGADLFFTDGSPSAGVDVVRDFSVGQGDRLQVGGGDYRVYQSGSATVVDFDNGAKVILENVSELPAGAIVGGSQAPPSGEAGVVIRSASTPAMLTGGAGADTLYAGQGADQLTGGMGADRFVFEVLPWRAGVVTDFADGADKIDLTALYEASGYGGADPVTDGYVRFESDGAGGARVMYDTDGRAATQAWAYHITTLQGVTPSSLSLADLLVPTGGDSPGGGDTQPGSGEQPSSGQVIRADEPGDILVGGSGADSLYASQGPDQLTGGGGADHFAFEALPWSAGVVTDFANGSDKIDLRALYQASGYSGSDAVADRYVTFESDGAGGTRVMYDTDGAGTAQAWSFHLTTLQGVAPSALSNADLVGGSTGGGNETQPGGGDTTSGQVLTSDQPGDTLAGGSGNDTLNAGQGPDQLTGAGGADRFVFAKPPWNAGAITDFAGGSDRIDVSALLDAYTGADPLADGWLRIEDASGSTQVFVDIDGAGGDWPFLITTLQDVAPGSVSLSDFIL